VPILARELSANYPVESYIIVGDYPQLTERLLVKNGVDSETITIVAQNEPSVIFDHLLNFSQKRIAAIGVGNIGGKGMEIVKFLERRGKLCSGLP